MKKNYKVLVFDWEGTLQSHSGQLFPKTREYLQLLNKKGYLLAIATGMSHVGLEQKLNYFSLRELFISYYCADQSLAKPDPLMLDLIRDELSVPCEKMLMIGDSWLDIEMARKAQIDSILLNTTHYSSSDFQQLHPTACLSSIADLVTWLSQRNELND